jgi:hypothetical protein
MSDSKSDYYMRKKCSLCGQYHQLCCCTPAEKAHYSTSELLSKVTDQGTRAEPLKTQEGGDHYKNRAIQPIEYISANKLGFSEGNIIKYATRHLEKGGAEDIRKIIHYAKFILKYEYNE